MDSKLVIQLLKSKTCEIQNLLDHFADQPNELESGIELLASRISGLSQDFEILKRNAESVPTQQKSEIKEPTEVSLTTDTSKEIIEVECEKSEPVIHSKEDIIIEELTDEVENHKEIDSSIINDQIQTEPIKIISEKLSAQKLTDIQSAIGINDRFLFTRELFNNNSEAYQAAILFVNESNNFDSVMNWIKKEQNWDLEDPTVIQFIEITKRKF